MKVCQVCLKEKQVDSKHHPAGACSQRCADKQLQRKAIAKIGGENEHLGIRHHLNSSHTVTAL
jgi:hypothetical protein